MEVGPALMTVCLALVSRDEPLPMALASPAVPPQVLEVLVATCRTYEQLDQLAAFEGVTKSAVDERFRVLRRLRWQGSRFPDTPARVHTPLPCAYKFFLWAPDGRTLYMVGDRGVCAYDGRSETLTHREFPVELPFYLERRSEFCVRCAGVYKHCIRLFVVSVGVIDYDFGTGSMKLMNNMQLAPQSPVFAYGMFHRGVPRNPQFSHLPHVPTVYPVCGMPDAMLSVRTDSAWELVFDGGHYVFSNLREKPLCAHLTRRKGLVWAFIGCTEKIFLWCQLNPPFTACIPTVLSDSVALTTSPSGDILCSVSSQISVSLYAINAEETGYAHIRLLDIHNAFVKIPEGGMPQGEQTVLVDDDKVIFYGTHEERRLVMWYFGRAPAVATIAAK